ncbi:MULTISPECIES: monoheme cytochrome C [Maribacter]|uniref:Monoheme cytochrome C n=1 Tax=Maribacter flavus TaxID=1658664 RepID=A0ABU7IJB8_9FLAO|nr:MULTISPECIES: monoheme cytochrome C [Maribacter]MDC6405464.1 monoheme cytochrome C [Maribacter sp. PR66]MEE1972768.1 monoheme cytochrome C [Maribacter flavus]
MKKKPIIRYIAIAAILMLTLGVVYLYKKQSEKTQYEDTYEVADENPDEIVDGIHVRTGLVAAEGLQEVITNCTTCHSSKLIVQNRMGKEQWNATIRWMQETQGLWDLGENQQIIVDYLTTNYPTFKKGRRASLTDIEWYTLESE